VATPPLADPHFDRSVVLVLEHDADGALGLVLNQPTDDTSSPGLRAWLDTASEPAVVFTGGPVDSDTYIGLVATAGRSVPDDPAGDASEAWAPLGPGLATVDLDTDPDEVGISLDAVRIFRGYAGWGAGQLDDELAEGAWIVVDSMTGDPFSDEPVDLWRRVLRRQGGRLAWLANCPDDITTN
jgi:putative transcriptional regulator